jgi:hypothetical protein
VEIPWPLFRRAALWLFAGALLVGFGVTALYRGHQVSGETWRVVFVLALAVLTMTSAVLLPGVLLPNVQSPHPEFLSEDLRDEWSELRQRSISRPHILMVAGIVAALVYLWSVLYYGKLTEAVWFGWLPVGVAGVSLALLLVAFARRTGWYNDRFFRTPTWVILVAFAGFGLALFLGIFMTEQVVALPEQPVVATDVDIDYGYVGSRAYNITRQYVEVGPVPDFEVPDCDDDACGYLFLVILFVALTLILVVGAALIPHMWVLSALVMLTMIGLLVLHEVRRDRSLAQAYGGVGRRRATA